MGHWGRTMVLGNGVEQWFVVTGGGQWVWGTGVDGIMVMVLWGENGYETRWAAQGIS